MIEFGVLPRIFYKPKEAFESLRGYTDKKDGVILWFTFTLISTLMFASVAQKLEMGFVLIPFGVGNSIEGYGVLLGFVSGLLTLLAIAKIGTIVAQRLGGTGYFSETLGMLGYLQVLSIPKAIASAVFLGLIVLRRVWVLNTTLAGGEVGNIMGPLFPALMIVNLAFLIWMYALGGIAMAAAHNISMPRGLLAYFVGFGSMSFLTLAISFLTGFSITVM